MRSVMILAALAEEADACFAGAGETSCENGLTIRRINQKDTRLRIVTTGIGKVNVSTAAALLHGSEPADLLLMTGTAGALRPSADQVFWLAEAIQHDYGAAQTGGFVTYSAGDWPIGPAVARAFSAMMDPGVNLPHARIASGDAFVACPQSAARLRDALGADIVDMETAALAQFAHRTGIAWAGVKATTDDANGDSEGDFMTNLREASAKAASAIERLIAIVARPSV